MDGDRSAAGRARRVVGRFSSLGVALIASGVLLVLPVPQRGPSAVAVPAVLAWPAAQRGTIPATLPDRTAYEPGIFLDARNSVGTAPSADRKFLRLVVRAANGSVRELRRLPQGDNPSFPAFTVAGDDVAWVEGTKSGNLRLWAVNVRDGRPARQVTADLGDAQFYRTQYDLLIADGSLHWVAAAAGPADATEVRSVPLAGGAVQVRIEPGRWKLSAWPWLANGVTNTAGTTALRDLATGRDVPVSGTRRAVTDCSPTWCRVAELTRDGSTRMELMHPDGSGRTRIGGATTATEIADVAVLDRFEVLAGIVPNTDLTGNVQLIVYELATRRTVEISPDAGSISYRAGVLWWSTGTRDAFVRHSIDLRTV